jgi:hypothetical protein
VFFTSLFTSLQVLQVGKMFNRSGHLKSKHHIYDSGSLSVSL